jgi:ABC-type branched-subunit amino acid transport system ATPase component/branched-subunit amino acid ABC-type transport system permease component
MTQLLLFALIGLGAGALYAALGIGVVVGFRGTGIINFAAGALAVWSVYVFDELRKTGDLVLPIVVVPHSLHLMSNPPFLFCLLIALLSSAALSLGVHFLVFRPLRNAPVLARVVSSVGILIVVQSLIVMHFGSDPRVMTPILPNETVTFSSVTFPRDRLWLSLIVAAIGLLLWAYLRFTRMGLATRGAAESESTVSLAGYSPQVLAGFTWLISGVVTSFVVILAGPLSSLNAGTYIFAIVPALAASLIGRLRSVSVTLVAGLGLGSFQSVVQYLTTKSWWPDWARTGLTDAVPFLVIVLALFLLGQSLPDRGSLRVDQLPPVRQPTIQTRYIFLCGLVAIGLMALLSGGYRFGLMTSLIVSMIMLSLVVLTGLVGQISLAQAGIAGTAGFALSMFCSVSGLNFPIGLFLSVLVSILVGVAVGIPALRIRGTQLAVVTLASGLALEKFVFRNSNFVSSSGSIISKPSLFGLDLGVREGRNIARLSFGILVVVFATLACIMVTNLIRSGTGRRLLAVRSNERAAASVGISVAASKLLAFAIASGLAGMGGCFIGYSRGQLSAESFTVFVSLSFMAFAYLGGITSVGGALVAGLSAPLGLTFVILDRNIELGQSYTLIAGVALILTAIFNPQGIAGRTAERFAALRHRGKTQDKSNESASPDVVRIASQPIKRDLSNAESVLQISGLTVKYGGLTAVGNVDLDVRKGEIVGLIGPNGAGKTTFIDAVTGFTHSEGVIQFDGREIRGVAPHEIARLGLRRTWQSVELFTDISISDNVLVALEDSTISSVVQDLIMPTKEKRKIQVDAALQAVGLNVDSRTDTNELSLGQQKLLGVARALVAQPKLLMLDEPAAGLSSSETQALGARIVDIAQSGTAVLLVDHDMDLVLEVCDRIFVLDFGRLIASGSPEQIQKDPGVIEAYLGATSEVES